MRVGQVHMMEYIILTIFIIILMVAFMILMTVFQIGGMESEGEENIYRQSLVITRFIISTSYLNNPRFPDGSMLDDSKLTTANCTELRKVTGHNWFAFVTKPHEGDDIICNEENYPECNKWIICDKKEIKADTCVHEVPVNIYNKMTNKIDIGIATVGLYGKCT